MKPKDRKSVTIKRRLVIKNCEWDFGLGPGVLVMDEIAYRDVAEDDNSQLAQQILHDTDEMLKRFIGIELEEI